MQTKYLHYLVFVSDNELGNAKIEPDWCQDAGPDCTLPYTKKYCNITCKGR